MMPLQYAILMCPFLCSFASRYKQLTVSHFFMWSDIVLTCHTDSIIQALSFIKCMRQVNLKRRTTLDTACRTLRQCSYVNVSHDLNFLTQHRSRIARGCHHVAGQLSKVASKKLYFSLICFYRWNF